MLKCISRQFNNSYKMFQTIFSFFEINYAIGTTLHWYTNLSLFFTQFRMCYDIFLLRAQDLMKTSNKRHLCIQYYWQTNKKINCKEETKPVSFIKMHFILPRMFVICLGNQYLTNGWTSWNGDIYTNIYCIWGICGIKNTKFLIDCFYKLHRVHLDGSKILNIIFVQIVYFPCLRL